MWNSEWRPEGTGEKFGMSQINAMMDKQTHWKSCFSKWVENRSDVWWEWYHMKWKHSKTKKAGAQCLQGQISCCLLFFLQKTVSFTSKHKDCFGSSWFKRLSWLVFCPMGGVPTGGFLFLFSLSFQKEIFKYQHKTLLSDWLSLAVE